MPLISKQLHTLEQASIETTSEKHSHFAKRFNQFITQNIGLDEIAIQMGVSISNLQRKVKAEFGQSAMSYIKAKKLEQAKVMLIADKLTIGEVAYMSGYNHAANFVTAFRKFHGVTPAQLRDKID